MWRQWSRYWVLIIIINNDIMLVYGWIKLHFWRSSPSCAIFRTALRATHVVFGGDLVSAGDPWSRPSLWSSLPNLPSNIRPSCIAQEILSVKKNPEQTENIQTMLISLATTLNATPCFSFFSRRARCRHFLCCFCALRRKLFLLPDFWGRLKTLTSGACRL